MQSVGSFQVIVWFLVSTAREKCCQDGLDIMPALPGRLHHLSAINNE
jgi:hypothetical protein